MLIGSDRFRNALSPDNCPLLARVPVRHGGKASIRASPPLTWVGVGHLIPVTKKVGEIDADIDRLVGSFWGDGVEVVVNFDLVDQAAKACQRALLEAVTRKLEVGVSGLHRHDASEWALTNVVGQTNDDVSCPVYPDPLALSRACRVVEKHVEDRFCMVEDRVHESLVGW